MQYLILVYPDNTPVALDKESGGYPIRTLHPWHAHVWLDDDDRTRYQQMFKKEGFKKATVTISVKVED
jgi:hypothetical protein